MDWLATTCKGAVSFFALQRIVFWKKAGESRLGIGGMKIGVMVLVFFVHLDLHGFVIGLRHKILEIISVIKDLKRCVVLVQRWRKLVDFDSSWQHELLFQFWFTRKWMIRIWNVTKTVVNLVSDLWDMWHAVDPLHPTPSVFARQWTDTKCQAKNNCFPSRKNKSSKVAAQQRIFMDFCCFLVFHHFSPRLLVPSLWSLSLFSPFDRPLVGDMARSGILGAVVLVGSLDGSLDHCGFSHSLRIQMGVSKNRGTPKWMVYNGKPYQNGWFGNIQIYP